MLVPAALDAADRPRLWTGATLAFAAIGAACWWFSRDMALPRAIAEPASCASRLCLAAILLWQLRRLRRDYCAATIERV